MPAIPSRRPSAKVKLTPFVDRDYFLSLTEPIDHDHPIHRTRQTMNRQLTLENSTLWGVWLGCCVFLNFPLGPRIYASQVFLCALVILWIFRKWRLGDGRSVLFVISSAVAFIVWELVVVRAGSNPRFVPELGKIILLIVLSLVLIDLFPHERVLSYARLIPVLVAILTASVYFVGDWDYYDDVLHRFGVPAFGSPNTTAYVLSFCLILLHYHLSHDLSRDRGISNRLVIFGSYAILAIGLIATQSRGGCATYLSGLIVLCKKKMRVLLAIGAAVGVVVALFSPLGQTVSRWNLVTDLRETGGTGRSFLWILLVQDLVRDPLSLIFGRGPGSISFYIAESSSPIESTHSMLVEIPYSYGLLGVLVFLFIFLRLWHLARKDSGGPLGSLRMALLVALMVSFVVDSYPLTGELLWFTPLLICFVAAPMRQGVSTYAGALPLALNRKEPLDKRTISTPI